MCSIMGYCDKRVDKDKFMEGFQRTISEDPTIVSRYTGNGLLDSIDLRLWALQTLGINHFS